MITIPAGQMMGTTMVAAVEDDMAEEMEELVLYAMAVEMAVAGKSSSISGMPRCRPADHRAVSAGGVPGHRRIPPLPAAVTLGGGVS